MKIFVDDAGRIKDVNTTENPDLTELTIDDEDNPFEGWSELKICCYKVQVSEGRVTSMTPYVDSTLIDLFDKIGKKLED